MARWSGWGAVPEVFDDRRHGVRLGPRPARRPARPRSELAAAARNTLNAHYTDAALVQAMWTAATKTSASRAARFWSRAAAAATSSASPRLPRT